MEDDAAQPEPGELTPADKLRQLEEEISRLKGQIEGSEADDEPGSKPTAESAGPETEESGSVELTPAELAEVDDLIRQASLARIRKQPSVASKLLKEAAAKAPNSARVLEALGDDQMERRVYNAAATSYEKALRLDAGNVGLEKKHADAIYYTHAAGIGLGMADDNFASPKARIFLAVLLPGVGQMVRGQWTKGIIILSGFVIGLIVTGVVKSASNPASGDGARYGFVIPLAFAVFFWLWGVIDASGGSSGPPSARPDRPKPPVDLPFE